MTQDPRKTLRPDHAETRSVVVGFVLALSAGAVQFFFPNFQEING